MKDHIRLPRVIFLDAVGTLFGVKGSVGQAYREIAHRHGVEADPTTLNQAFFQQFKAAAPMITSALPSEAVPVAEYQWWHGIAHRTFAAGGYLEAFSDFDGFFADLYQYFATADPWVLYDDTPPALSRWQRQGIELGVISNFDSRLYQVLSALDLDGWFQSVTISSEVGTAKPGAHIFQVALEKHRCPAHQAWHVGDSQREDVAGAKAAGLHPVWIDREP